MKHLVTVSMFSVVSSLAFAESTPATPAATAAAKDNGTKINMRIHLDPFYKNINDTAKNYKIPKLESLRLFVERDFGKYSKADVEIRLQELESRENSKKKLWYKDTNEDGKVLVNTNVLKYFHVLFDVPAVEGLQVGYVREMEPALYGYTDKPKSTNVVESPSFTGHMGRVEGYRAVYKIDDQNKVTYHVARNQDQNEYSLGTKPADTTWYHKLTSNNTFGDTSVETGLGIQGDWLDLKDSTKLKYNNFFHVVAEHKMDALKLKGGLAYDNYAVTKVSTEGKTEAAVANATTVLVAAKYDLVPKEFTLIGEVGYRTLKLPSDNYTDFTKDNKPKVDSAGEASFVLAGQYFLDEKLSFIPSYNYYNSNRAHANSGNTTGDAVLSDRKELVGGSDRATAKSEHAFGLRIRYDY